MPRGPTRKLSSTVVLPPLAGALRSFLSHPTVLCALAVWSLWLAVTAGMDLQALYARDWPIAATMAVGSFIAGATSEGGGAVAFPVLTLVFGTAPAAARDFSLMIQSVGMTAASLTILALRIPVAPRPVLFASLGGAAGMIFGLEYVAPALSPPFAKTFFTSCWLSFGVALLLINRDRTRHARMVRSVALADPRSRALLIGIGFLGGIVSSITGSGLDLLTFAVLVLVFHLSEAVATPSSVLMMAGNALVGFAWKASFASTPIHPVAWDFWTVAIPVVVVGAPLGALVISKCPRAVLIGLLLTSITAQYVATLMLIPQTARLLSFNLAVLAVGSGLFLLLARIAARRTAGTP